ncbi:MAG: DUF2784 domain-containing protein [Stellaceae bacterium]
MVLAPATEATVILLVHLAVVAFNVFGLVIIPVGKVLGWEFVRSFWWRFAHVLSLAVVALQAVLGRACFLTIWENALSAERGTSDVPPMIASWINSVLYWPLPLWMFAAGYLGVLLYALMLWRWVPPRIRAAQRIRLSAR